MNFISQLFWKNSKCISKKFILSQSSIRRITHKQTFQKFNLRYIYTQSFYPQNFSRKMDEQKDTEKTNPTPESKGEVVKTVAQLKKEAKRLAKLEKFAKKQESTANKKSKPSAEEKAKPKKEKTTKKTTTYDVNTPVGDKKDIVSPLPDAYSPPYVESAWYAWWEKKGFFKPEYKTSSIHANANNGNFTIVIPPPNVTGSLHLGHGLANSIEDVITRWHRMNGRTALWVPGCDHAGIATQVVVERKMKREENLTRHHLGRDKFIERVWDWKNTKGDRIYYQMRKLAISVDWDRTSFTMDKKLCRAVREAFVRLHDKKLIYRSNRLVNWSCALNSAISDIEVDKKEVTGRTVMSVPGYEQKIEFGVLIHFNYAIEATDETITVATTRLETMLGDTGIAVHPADKRYKHLIGKHALHPFCHRKLLVVADDAVDPAFGTGAVKITPAHDHNDYEIGKRHNLPFINMLNESGIVRDVGDFKDEYKKFAQMKRFVARYEVLNELKAINMYLKTEDNAMVIPMCSRSKDVVEPFLIPQWYVDCKEMSQKAVQAVRGGDLKIIPQSHEKTWYSWMENCRDWCISRQLWWGHRIPAYFATVEGEASVSDADDNHWVSGRTEDEARQKAAERFNVAVERIHLRQDEDVLDTWFSSALFPFSVFGWPENTEDLKAFYPTSLLETGHDILFFWVARMVMFGQELTGQLPFKEVYLHAMVRDAYGRKMSKSLGNVIDPLDVVSGISLDGLMARLTEYNLEPKELEKAKKGQKEMFPAGIPECGTDALRFALCAYTSQGRDINLDVLRIQGYRHFCNKLWNATKFAMLKFADNFTPRENQLEFSGNESAMDKWVLSRLTAATDASNEGFATYDFPKCTTALYNFWLYDLCDIYLESLKPVFMGTDEARKTCAQNVLYTCLDSGLRLLSPFMPFLTEELYQRLPHNTNTSRPESVCVASYPKQLPWRNKELENDIDKTMEIVKAVRSLKEEYINTKTKAPVYLKPHQEELKKVIENMSDVIATLSNSAEVTLIGDKGSSPSGCAIHHLGDRCQVFLMLKGIVDFAKEMEKMKSKEVKTQQQLKKLIEGTQVKDYSTKVPEKVQQQNSEKITQLETELKKLRVTVETFEKEANQTPQ